MELHNNLTEFLGTMRAALIKWEVDKNKGNDQTVTVDEVIKRIDRLRHIVEYFEYKDANWGAVTTLANIHGMLGEMMHEKYELHHGYSKSAEQGMKRHYEAVIKLLDELLIRINNLKKENSTEGLYKWKTFLDEILSGFEFRQIK